MTERTITLVLTQTECNQLANLLDVAVKAGGIQIAKGALYFIQKMEAELNKPEIPPEVLSKEESDRIKRSLGMDVTPGLTGK
jgi:exo-beta-1,3-glucanase (GH17 family)